MRNEALCPASETGRHDVDLQTLRSEDGFIDSDEIGIEITCSRCGAHAMGSLVVNDFYWSESELFRAGDWFSWNVSERENERVVYARVIATGSLSDNAPGYKVEVHASDAPPGGVPGFYMFRFRAEFVLLTEAQVEAARIAGWPDSISGVRETLGDSLADRLARAGSHVHTSCPS